MKQMTVRLKPGQLLKEEMEKIAVTESVNAGVLLSVVGGLKNAVLRMPGSTPEDQKVKKWDGPFEIVSGTGAISKDGCHIHISVSDCDGNVLGGHLRGGALSETQPKLSWECSRTSLIKENLMMKRGLMS